MAVKIIHDMSIALYEDNEPLEAVVMQAVNHPNVLRLFDYKTARTSKGEERLWLLLEFCDTGTLAVSIVNGIVILKMAWLAISFQSVLEDQSDDSNPWAVNLDSHSDTCRMLLTKGISELPPSRPPRCR